MQLLIRSKMLSSHTLMIKVSTMVAVHSASGLFQTPPSSLVWLTVLSWCSGYGSELCTISISLLHRFVGTGLLHHSLAERRFSLRRINQNFLIFFWCQGVSVLGVLVSLLRHFSGLSRGVQNKRTLHTQGHTACTAQIYFLSCCFLCVTECLTTNLLQRLFELLVFRALTTVSY